MQRIYTIIDKEWAEVFKNRTVLMTVGIMPLIFTLLPLAIVYGTQTIGEGGDVTDVPPQFLQICGAIEPGACLQLYLINTFLLMYMLMPLAIPIAIAAYSIVGEKTTRSLEPLLATPVTTLELLAAKSLAAVIPAIGATWGAFAVFVACLPWLHIHPAVFAGILSPTWLLGIFLVGPLMAVMAVNCALIVSARVSDPRTAEQISMIIILPVLGLLFAQLAGVVIINPTLMLTAAAILAVVDGGLMYAGARWFDRETILTQWR